MCFSLMGFVNDDVDYQAVRKISMLHGNYWQDLEQFDCDLPHRFPRIEGTIGLVLHGGCCDCDSAVGRGNPDRQELQDDLVWLHALRQCPNIRFLYLAKVWDPLKEFGPAQCIPMDKASARCLANMRENTPYQFLFSSAE